jgi:RNA polymerase sigma factor (sigma-70 family)
MNLLSQEETARLILLSRTGDRTARDRVCMANQRMVAKIAHGFWVRQRSLGFTLEDLMGYGQEGLLGAIDRYDVNGRASFSTFAYDTIWGTISNYIGDLGLLIRLPRNHWHLRNKVEASEKAGETASDRDVAERFHVSMGVAKQLRRRISQTRDVPMSEISGMSSHADVDGQIDAISIVERLMRATVLTDAQRAIIAEVYEVGPRNPEAMRRVSGKSSLEKRAIANLAQTAKRFGISLEGCIREPLQQSA